MGDLGSHPDKAKINAITMLAEDYADDREGAEEFYKIVRSRILSADTANACKLPLVYLVDSILNNAKGEFMAVVEDTISRVFLSVYIKIAEAHKKKLKRLLGIWKDNERFSGETIATMEGFCSSSSLSLSSIPAVDVDDLRAMLTSMGEDVSLEDLIKKDPELVKNMYNNLSVFREERDKHEAESAVEPQTFWERPEAQDVNLLEASGIMKKLEDILLERVRNGEGEGAPLLLAAAGTKKYLQTLVTSFKNKPHEDVFSSANTTSNVDPADFTSEMLGHNTKQNDNVVFTLYGALPFDSKVDGRRFNSQVLLKEHLEALSKVDELTICMNALGWFQGEENWLEASELNPAAGEDDGEGGDNAAEEDDKKDVVEADEMRDKCMICGKKFVNVYDDDECMYFSQDARELVVEEDNGMETDEVLVHASCCKKLGLEEGAPLPRKQVFLE